MIWDAVISAWRGAPSRPDPRFDQQRFDARLEKARAVLMPNLEKEHDRFLDMDWKSDGPEFRILEK